MRVTVSIEGDIAEIVQAQVGEVADRLRGAVSGVAQRTEAKLRGQVASAGLGMGLQRAWQTQNYPTGRRTLSPASLVISKSQVLHAAFSEGAAILPRRGRFIVIPLAGAISRGFDRTTVNRKGGAVPGGMKRKASRLDDAAEALGAEIVSVRGGSRGRAERSRGAAPQRRPQILLLPSTKRPGALLAVLKRPDDEDEGEPLFLLLRATRVPKLLDIASVRREAESELRSAVTGALSG